MITWDLSGRHVSYIVGILFSRLLTVLSLVSKLGTSPKEGRKSVRYQGRVSYALVICGVR